MTSHVVALTLFPLFRNCRENPDMLTLRARHAFIHVDASTRRVSVRVRKKKRCSTIRSIPRGKHRPMGRKELFQSVSRYRKIPKLH
jgi:hypothetical protein